MAFNTQLKLWYFKGACNSLESEDIYWTVSLSRTDGQLLSFQHYNLSFMLFNIYDPSSIVGKVRLWKQLSNMFQRFQDQNIILGGDFNAITSLHEKKGGILPPSRTMEDFVAFINDKDLFDVILSKGTFAWNNKRDGFCQITERLDRFLVSPSWKLQNYALSSNFLPYSASDHFLIVLNLSKESDYKSFKKATIKFEHMWFRHPHILPPLHQWWVSSPNCEGTKMYHFYHKIQYVKGSIKHWNKHVFKNIFHQKNCVGKQLHAINEHVIVNGFDLDMFLKQKNLQAKWEDFCKTEEEFWRQRSKEIWLEEVDKNTKFFHMSVKQRRAANTIFEIEEASSSRLLKESQKIKAEGKTFFQNLLTPQTNPYSSHICDHELLDAIPILVSREDNIQLMIRFTMMEL